METKQCNKCGEVKNKEEFQRNKKRNDGFQSYCKQCDAKKRKEEISEKQCETCGNVFIPQTKGARFCDDKCRRYETKCINCNKNFLGMSPTSSYCTEECKHQFKKLTAASFTEKKCSKCGHLKNIGEFSKHIDALTGRKGACKECERKYHRDKNRKKKLEEYMESIGYEEVDKSIPSHINLNDTKPCSICEVDKPLKEFRVVYKDKKFNRFHAHCKECTKEKNKEYRHQKELEKYREMKARGRGE